MATVVIGGSGAGVGKTTFACALLAALPEFHWTGLKITSHAQGLPEPIFEERVAGRYSDTARYLVAGARRALLMTAREAELPLDAMEMACGCDPYVLIESNRIIEYLLPDVCLAVIGDGEETKLSFAALLHHADAVVARSQSALDRFQLPAAACQFCLKDLNRVPPELTVWLRGRLPRFRANSEYM